jgi:hypothetical protein
LTSKITARFWELTLDRLDRYKTQNTVKIKEEQKIEVEKAPRKHWLPLLFQILSVTNS